MKKRIRFNGKKKKDKDTTDVQDTPSSNLFSQELSATLEDEAMQWANCSQTFEPTQEEPDEEEPPHKKQTIQRAGILAHDVKVGCSKVKTNFKDKDGNYHLDVFTIKGIFSLCGIPLPAMLDPVVAKTPFVPLLKLKRLIEAIDPDVEKAQQKKLRLSRDKETAEQRTRVLEQHDTPLLDDFDLNDIMDKRLKSMNMKSEFEVQIKWIISNIQPLQNFLQGAVQSGFTKDSLTNDTPPETQEDVFQALCFNIEKMTRLENEQKKLAYLTGQLIEHLYNPKNLKDKNGEKCVAKDFPQITQILKEQNVVDVSTNTLMNYHNYWKLTDKYPLFMRCSLSYYKLAVLSVSLMRNLGLKKYKDLALKFSQFKFDVAEFEVSTEMNKLDMAE